MTTHLIPLKSTPIPGSVSGSTPEPSLHLIPLDIIELGYTDFISSWLYTGPEGFFLTDPGPACTIPVLTAALRSRGINELDYILLTHIHMDHAGGIGHLLEEFPNAKVVCHEKAVRHLIDPSGLWEGSRTVIGKVADVYGGILPIPDENIIVADRIEFGGGISVIPAPGHASHHQCFAFRDYLFAGELFGTYVHLQSELYLRPATPSRFVLGDYLTSMDRIEKFLRPKICFAHYGSCEGPADILNSARSQLKLWVRLIDENGEKELDEIINILLTGDRIFGRMRKLTPVIQKREFHFARNSISGILSYLRSK